MSGQIILRHILSSISDELTYIVRDEVLLITTKDDAGEELDTPAAGSAGNDANRDPGDQFIKQWLESAADTTDSAALRAALQAHLEQEFDPESTDSSSRAPAARATARTSSQVE